MQYTEIIKLLDAGYTRDEIMNMKEPEPNDPKPGDPKPGDPKPGDPKPDDPKQDDPKPDETVNAALDELKSLFSDMKKEFTAMNIMNSRREDETISGDDVLASIINPPKTNNNKGR